MKNVMTDDFDAVVEVAAEKCAVKVAVTVSIKRLCYYTCNLPYLEIGRFELKCRTLIFHRD